MTGANAGMPVLLIDTVLSIQSRRCQGLDELYRLMRHRTPGDTVWVSLAKAKTEWYKLHYRDLR